jgi:hypothetical protein
MKCKVLLGAQSSIASCQLIKACGKTVVADCVTRWNSTYMMCERLIKIKQPVVDALNLINADGLLSSEWSRIEELVELLEPFYNQTNVLQSDASSLSAVIPALMDLECHLNQGTTLSAARKVMREKLTSKFGCVLDPYSPDFNPLPAAACLLDPTLAVTMTTSRATTLMEAARQYIATHQEVCEVSSSGSGNSETSESDVVCPPALKKFKFLSSQLSTEPRPRMDQHRDDQLERYIAEIKEIQVNDKLSFWKDRRVTYSKLYKVAMDLLVAPASQAFVERMFSVCGYLSAGRRNRLDKNLELRAFLKMNQKFL